MAATYPKLLAVVLVAFAVGTPRSSPAATFSESDLFVGGQDGYHTFRVPALAILPSGTILAFAEGRKDNVRDHGNIDLVMKRSLDAGKTWSNLQLVYEEGGTAKITIGNPAPVVDRTTGAVHLVFSRDNRDVFVTSSIDEGQTFSPPVDITGVARQINYPWISIGPGPIAGIQTRTGRLIVPIWIKHRLDDPATNRSAVLFSDDHGATWQAGNVAPVSGKVCGTNECAVVELADGRLYMTQRIKVDYGIQANTTGIPARSKSFSADGGVTWTEAEIEPAINPNMSMVQASILRYSLIDNSDKNRILFSAPGTNSRDEMTVWVSEDEAETWPMAKTIYRGPSGYSALAVTRDMKILLLYERGERRYDDRIALARFDLDWLINPDGN